MVAEELRVLSPLIEEKILAGTVKIVKGRYDVVTGRGNLDSVIANMF